MKHQETYRHEAAATATALAPITEETLQARSRENKAKVADLRQQLEKMEHTRQATQVETYQWLWNIHEEYGVAIYDDVLAGHTYDIEAVRLIGSNLLLKEARNITRSPLDFSALLFVCAKTRDEKGVYYAPLKMHLESGILKFATLSGIKTMIGWDADAAGCSKSSSVKKMSVAELIQRLTPFGDDEEYTVTFGQGKLFLRNDQNKTVARISNQS